MKKISTLLLFALLFFLFPFKTYADGLIMPPDDYWMYETAQEGFIIYDGETEILVLSTSFSGSANDFGWIIPIPNEPEVERARNDIFDDLYELTEPKQNPLNKIVSPEYDYYYPMYMEGLGSAEEDTQERSVTVIEEKRVGVFDIAILYATDVTDLEEWLDENGYNIPENPSQEDYPYERVYDDEGNEYDATEFFSAEVSSLDESKVLLQEYIDAEWYFIAVKVNNMFIEDSTVNMSESGVLNPLRITFETSDIVFPLKISSLSGESVDITLFTLTDQKVWVSNYEDISCDKYFYYSYDTENECSDFKMIYGTMIEPDQISNLTNVIGKGSWFESNSQMYLARHNASWLYPDDMTADVLFEDQNSDTGLNDGSMKITQWLVLPIAFLVYGPRNLITAAASSYYGSSIAVAVIIITVIMSAILSVLIYLKLKKTTIRSQRILLNIVQFPLVAISSTSIGIMIGVVWAFIQIALSISTDAAVINAVLTAFFLSLGCILLFYRFQWRKK